jgi:sporulation protein YlmC with PRC-barrel domain
MSAKSANGISGHLIYTGEGKYVFRVYNKEFNFVDYDLMHSDLHITIVDEDAFFYRDEYKDVLDHSPETLGIKDV